jgi:indole-3-glycerol phosphate synthase
VAAISVLTDEKYFQGGLSIMEDVADAVSLPVLRKDFIIDPYQIYEAAHHGASAVLLIAAILEASVLKQFIRLCRSLRLSALVEVHTQDELKKALKCGPEIIGINNRDLDTFRTDLRTTLRLLEHVPGEEYIIVSESGIRSRRDALRLKEAGVHAILVGESLMAAKDIGAKLKELKV